MYQKILVALENSQADESLLPHVTERIWGELGEEGTEPIWNPPPKSSGPWA